MARRLFLASWGMRSPHRKKLVSFRLHSSLRALILMQHANTSLLELPDSEYRGSERTRDSVRKQLMERFGASSASIYDPKKNVRTLNSWRKLGYRVKRGETALRSVTIIPKKDGDGNVIGTYPKTICLFFQSQVERVGGAGSSNA